MRSEFCPLLLRNANIDIKTIMENREQQILSEIRQMISSMRDQLDVIEAKLAQLAQDGDIEVVDEAPIDIDIDGFLDEITVDLPDDDLPFVDEPVVKSQEEPLQNPVVEQVEEPVEEPVEQLVEEPVEEPVEDLVAEPAATEMLIDAAVANARPTVIDVMAAKEAWRTAIPGSPVKDIRSAISLHDRIIFINGLFDEDPMFFQEVLTAINSISSLDEAVEYLAQKRPEWDMNSDEVYRFMMAVRRRIQ